MYRFTKLSVKDSVKMGLRELQIPYQKVIGEEGEKVAKIIWQKNHWHRLFKDTFLPFFPGNRAVAIWKKLGTVKKKKKKRRRGGARKKSCLGFFLSGEDSGGERERERW